MNNCIFTTHATLTKEHAEYSLRSLLTNQTTPIVWDWFIIYNTHSHTIDNDWLQDKIKEKINKFNLFMVLKLFANFIIFPVLYLLKK